MYFTSLNSVVGLIRFFNPKSLQMMKRKLSAPLSVPNLKKRSQQDRLGSPFPVPVGSLTGVEPSNNYWSVYRGDLQLQARPGVLVTSPAQVTAIHSNGAFGEVLVPRRLEDLARPVISDWTPGCDNVEVSRVELDLQEAGDREKPRSWAQMKESKESELFLELSEAFFLSYSLGCLIVSEGQTELSLQQQWRRFCCLQPDFPLIYRVYHHYRSRGWVVRSGATMGVDWVLYKGSPAVSHSTYCVRVEMVDRREGRAIKDLVKTLTWSDILGSSRVTGTIKKDLLVARVGVRADKSDWLSPHCLAGMTVSSSRLRRWVPGDMRWSSKPAVPVLSLH